jgi:Lrp/AsnC family leucine-responsive transcriptional regulator
MELDRFDRQLLNLPRYHRLRGFMARMVRENPNVRRFDTHVALSVLKRGLTIPIPLSDGSTSPAAE